MAIVITFPQGVIIQSASGSMQLIWNGSAASNWSSAFNKAQKYIDNEVVRFCSSRVPLKTGMLQKSGISGTTPGSGEVRYTAPYAGRQYYHTASSRSYDANRGAYWFERGKAAERANILRGAASILAGS